MVRFANGEKVLCFHGNFVYEAKCLKSKITKDNHICYLIHYNGWNENLIEWVPESRIFRYNEAHKQLFKELLKVNNEEPVKSKNETDIMDENETNNVVENETSQKYPCTTCNKVFLTQLDIDKHWQWHIIQLEHMQSCCVKLNQIEIFKCDFCICCFPDVGMLKAHQNKCLNKKNKNQVNESSQEFASYKTLPSQSDLVKHMESHTLQLDHEAEIIMDENETNKIDGNKTNYIDGNKSNNMDDNESNKMDQIKTNKVNEASFITGKNNENETNKIDANKTNKMDENEISKMIGNETNKINDNETNKTDEKVTNYMDGNKSINMDENETNKIDDNKTNNMGENETNKLDDNETNNMNEKETNYMNGIKSNNMYENETNKLDDNETNNMNEKETNYMNGNKSNNMYENETNKLDDNETNNMNEKETNYMNGNKSNNMDENETNKLDDNETKSIDENETNKIKDKETNEMPKNKISQKYSCTKCTKTFLIQSDLDKHLQVHSLQLEFMLSCSVKLNRVKILKCEFCTSCFLHVAKLKEHQRKYFKQDLSTSQNNNNQKPFKCEVCGWRFMKESTLEAHSTLHEPFPHICECGIGYYQRCDLNAHRKLVHPNYKPLPLKVKQETKPESKASTQLKPHNKLGPRLKATLTFKQPKTKTKKLKRLKGGRTNKLHRKSENPIKQKGVKSEIKMKLETDENGNYACTLCAQTYLDIVDLRSHMLKDHTEKDAGKYKCNACGKEAVYLSKLGEHMLRHAGMAYVCHICNGRFSQSGALNLHLKRHAGDKQFPCKECDKSFYNAAALRLHSRVHTGEKPFECKQCGKSFSDPSAYRRHLIIHTGLQPYKCQRCPKAFCDPAALFRHNRIHDGYKASCFICNRTFSSTDSMRKHHKLAHTKLRDEDKFECDHCGIKCTRKHNLVKHTKNVHMNPTPSVECEICFKKYTTKSYLMAHVKTVHLNLTSEVECEICCKKYVSADNLKKHMQLVHLKITRFECKICGARFLNKCVLKYHKKNAHRSKTMHKIYECDHCCKLFSSKQILAMHIVKSHLGIKCLICKKTFTTSLRLKHHKSEGCRRCTVCNKAFKTPNALEQHYIVTHLHKSDRQMYECDYCRKQFPLKCRLLNHIKIHIQPADSFHCDHCSEVFPRKKAVETHIWDKHMISLYCNICLKGFYRDCEFRRHKRSAVGCRPIKDKCEICNKKVRTMRRHLLLHGPKRVECDMCGAKFSLKQTLESHIKQNHNPKDLCQ